MRIAKIEASSDIVIVEGAGGIMTPINWASTRSHQKDNADLARALNLDIAIVIANRAECINSAMLTIHYAKSRGLGFVGMILNDIDATNSPTTETNQAIVAQDDRGSVVGPHPLQATGASRNHRRPPNGALGPPSRITGLPLAQSSGYFVNPMAGQLDLALGPPRATLPRR